MLKIEVPKIKTVDTLFFFSYGVFMIFAILSTSFFYRYFYGEFFKLILILCVSVLILREFLVEQYTLKSMVTACVCVLLMMVMWRTEFVAVQQQASVMFVFVYCARNIPFEKIAGFTIFVSTIVVGIIIAGSFAGIIENYITISEKGRVRSYLGFLYALHASKYVSNITLLYIYLKKNKITWGMLFLILLINWWVFIKTNARLSFYMILILFCIVALMKFRPRFMEKRRNLCRLMVTSYVLCFIGNLYMTIAFSDSVRWMREMDKLFDGRFSLAHSSWILNGVSLFGKNINWVGNGLDAYGNQNTAVYTYVDSMYIQTLQRYGIVFTVGIVILFTMILFMCYRKKDYYLMIIFAFMAIYSIIDDLMLYLYFNTFWFTLGTLLPGIAGKKHEKKCVVKQGMES